MKNTITFLLNDQLVTLEQVDPNLTVLNYLRTVEHLTGTKEGCAEGDCGACTVVLGELINDEIRYRAVNSCILFIGCLDGKQLITVEGLKTREGELHPVQKAMVELHGSQCGFCTPGIIMSLFAVYKNYNAPDEQTILNALAGNLCRCTGYRPIVDAAKLMYKYEEEDDFIKYNESILGILRDIQPDETLHLDFEGREFFAPMDLDELLVLRKNHPDAKILAGGTDIGLTLTKGGQVLQKLISVEHVEELHLSNLTKEYVELGASVSLSDVLDTLKQHIPQFASLVTRIGSVQIRNQGTMGGNLVNASPIGDSAPLLLALDATVTIKSLESERELALSDFFTGYRMTALKPGEILYSIKVPIPTDSVFRCYKVSKRFDQDISTVCGAFTLKLNRENIVTDFRAAFGGMAATPIRATQVEALLLGKPWDEKNAKLASDKLKEELHPMTDFRGSSDYRSKVAGNLIFRFYLETCGSDEYMEVISYE